MKNEGYDHIRKYIDGCVNDKEVQTLISDFAILWNQYEDELYDREHHIKDIPKVINNLDISKYETTINELYKRLIEYIKSKNKYDYYSIIESYNILIKVPLIRNHQVQYYNNGDIVYTGEISEEELKKIMVSDKLEDKLHFMLLIIARVRNNMFHGRKAIYNLTGQKNLFRVCNETLKLVIDMEKKTNY